jgi:hypothetical protein
MSIVIHWLFIVALLLVLLSVVHTLVKSLYLIFLCRLLFPFLFINLRYFINIGRFFFVSVSELFHVFVLWALLIYLIMGCWFSFFGKTYCMPTATYITLIRPKPTFFYVVIKFYIVSIFCQPFM